MFNVRVCVCSNVYICTQWPEDGVSSFGTGVTGEFDLPNMCAGNQTWSFGRAASTLNSGDNSLIPHLLFLEIEFFSLG